jgi:hypothetical protein
MHGITLSSNAADNYGNSNNKNQTISQDDLVKSIKNPEKNAVDGKVQTLDLFR